MLADCCSTVCRATRNRITPPVRASTGNEISKFSSMLRPSRPARASAAAENRIALPCVLPTNGTRILIGPSIRNSMRKILRAPNSGPPGPFRMALARMRASRGAPRAPPSGKVTSGGFGRTVAARKLLDHRCSSRWQSPLLSPESTHLLSGWTDAVTSGKASREHSVSCSLANRDTNVVRQPVVTKWNDSVGKNGSVQCNGTHSPAGFL